MTVWLDAATALWLIPCAWQDVRTRRVSNVLTVPLFLAAWPAAAWRGPNWILFTFLTFLVSVWGWERGWLGPADGKALTGMAGLAPMSLLWLFPVLLAAVVYRRIARRNGKEPGMLFFAVAAALSALTSPWVSRIIMAYQGFRV